MSHENVEIVRSVIDAHERGDAEAVFSQYDPEIEWHLSTVFASVSEFDPVYYGHDGVRTFWRTWFSAWEKASFEYEEFIDAGDSVVTVLSQHVRGRVSGIELDWESYGQIWTVRDSKIIRVEFVHNRDEALEAAGLSE
jgi:ketosteroid isomerase-like protein